MSTIEKAADATTAIQDHVETALKALGHGFNGRVFNGCGIYANPSNCHHNLLEAKQAIDTALNIMRATKWPTDAEYDLSE